MLLKMLLKTTPLEGHQDKVDVTISQYFTRTQFKYYYATISVTFKQYQNATKVLLCLCATTTCAILSRCRDTSNTQLTKKYETKILSYLGTVERIVVCS